MKNMSHFGIIIISGTVGLKIKKSICHYADFLWFPSYFSETHFGKASQGDWEVTLRYSNPIPLVLKQPQMVLILYMRTSPTKPWFLGWCLVLEGLFFLRNSSFSGDKLSTANHSQGYSQRPRYIWWGNKVDKM